MATESDESVAMTCEGAYVRGARLGDAGEIARLSAQLGYPLCLEETARRLTRLLADDKHHIGVVADGSHLLGWMHVEHRYSLEGGARAEILGLVGDAAARRRGVGRALVATAEQWARAQGLAVLTVRSNAARELSHPFYESLGYVRAKTQHVYTKRL